MIAVPGTRAGLDVATERAALDGNSRRDLRRGRVGWHPLGVSFTLRELAAWTGGELLDCPDDVVIDRLVIDSRQAGPGSLFVALTGETTDGHRFIPDALAAGTSALLCTSAPAGTATPRVVVRDTREALVGFSRGKLAASGVRVVGVTGSAGKTTTKEIIAAVLGARHQVARTEGNLNTYTGLPMNLARLEPGHDVFVAEYGMSALGEIAFLTRMAPPDIAVVLNVGLAHVGLLGSIENIARAKMELVEAVPADGVAVLNADDPRVTAMAHACRGRVVYFGVNGAGRADYRASGLELGGLTGSRFTLHTPDGSCEVHIPFPGLHSVANCVAAAAVGHLLGVGLEETAGILSGLSAVGGRMSMRAGRMGSTVIDDAYNASPGSMEASLEVLRSAGGRPRIAVLGDMLELGDEALAAHRRLGATAARTADVLVAVGEHAGDVTEAARAAGMADAKCVAAGDIEEALAALDGWLPGAVVLVKASRGVGLDRLVERLLA